MTATSRTFQLGKIAADRLSDVIIMMTRLRPEGTGVELELVMPSGQRYSMIPESGLELPDYVTGEITVNVTLRGNERMSPILRADAQIVQGTIAETATYISRFMPAGSGSKSKVVFDINTPGHSGFTVEAQTAGTPAAPVWSEMPSVHAAPLGDGLVENEFALPVDQPETRFKVTLKGGPSARPRLSSLRGVVVPNI